MEFFPDEQVHITALQFVIHYRGTMQPHDYSGRLKHCELIYKLSGKCHVHFDGRDFVEKPGDLRLLPYTGRYVRYHAEPIEQGDCIYFSFDYDGAHPDGAASLTPRAPDQYRVLFDRLHRVWTMHETGYYQKALSLVYQIIGCIQAEQDEHYLSGRQREALDRSTLFLETHMFDPHFDYAALAEASGVSYSYYKRLFGQRFGMPPSKYVLSLRLRRACELLETGLLSVSQTASAVGFEDAAYFCRVFTKELGVSPAAWRKARRT